MKIHNMNLTYKTYLKYLSYRIKGIYILHVVVLRCDTYSTTRCHNPQNSKYYHSLPGKPRTMHVYILCIMIKYPSYIINSIISLMNVTF